MPLAVGYVRTSTDEQALSIEVQQNAIEEWCETNGVVLRDTLVDRGISGSTPLDERPALLRAVQMLAADDVLLVLRRDRLGRDEFHVAGIERIVWKRSARIVTADGSCPDDNSPSTQLIVRMMDLIGQYERAMIRTRTIEALQRKRVRMERVSGHAPMGYRFGRGGHLEENPEELLAVEEMQRLRAKGMGYREIARMMGDMGYKPRGKQWYHFTVRKMLAQYDDVAYRAVVESDLDDEEE